MARQTLPRHRSAARLSPRHPSCRVIMHGAAQTFRRARKIGVAKSVRFEKKLTSVRFKNTLQKMLKLKKKSRVASIFSLTQQAGEFRGFFLYEAKHAGGADTSTAAVEISPPELPMRVRLILTWSSSARKSNPCGCPKLAR